MTDLSNSSWRTNAACMAGASCSQSLVEPSMSVNRNVTVPVGGLATTVVSSLLPLRGHYSTGALPGPSVHPSVCTRLLSLCRTHLSAAYEPVREGDRRDSNPRPSEPQSADTCFQVLPHVAESAYISLFLCSRLPAVSACSVLSGVSSGVKRDRLHLCPDPTYRTGYLAGR